MKLTSIKNSDNEYAHAYVVIKNTTTGIVHLSAGSRSRCGSSKKNKYVTVKDASSTKDYNFCEKCFSNGKPDNFYEIQV